LIYPAANTFHRHGAPGCAQIYKNLANKNQFLKADIDNKGENWKNSNLSPSTPKSRLKEVLTSQIFISKVVKIFLMPFL